MIEDYKDLYQELVGGKTQEERCEPGGNALEAGDKQVKEGQPRQSAKLTDALVAMLLTENGHLPEDARVKIRRLEGGKPVLAEPADTGIHFSVSHTGNLFACVIAGGEVGLDIQETRRTNADRLARRYFTNEENRWLAQSGLTTDDTSAFFRLWTRKEAYAKYTGRGLASVLAGEPVLGRNDVAFTELTLGDGVYGCICMETD